MTDEKTVGLPELLGRYFWEYAPGRLTWPEHRYTIILRLLEKGGWDAVRWLRGNVSASDLSPVHHRQTRPRARSQATRYWELILGLPRDQVDGWVQAARQSPWFNR